VLVSILAIPRITLAYVSGGELMAEPITDHDRDVVRRDRRDRRG